MKKILEYLFVITMIISTNTVYAHNLNYNVHSRILFIIIAFLYFCYLFYSKQIVLNKKKILILLIYFIYILNFYIFNNISMEKKWDFIFSFIVLLPLLYLTYSLSKKRISNSILEKYSNIIVIISSISLIIYILGPVFNIIYPTGNLILNWEEYPKNISSYYSLLFIIQKINFLGLNVIRNTSFFTEAPMFSINLIIALSYNLLLRKGKRRKLSNIILIIVIITTFSTTAYILCLFILIINFILNNGKNAIINKIKKLFVPFILITGLIIFTIIVNDKTDSASYRIRMDDYTSSIKAWTDKPIFGNGFGDNSSIVKYMKKNRYSGTSNSVGVLLAQSGLYLFMIYVVPFILFIKKSTKNKNSKLFSIIICILYFVTSVTYSPLILNFIAIAFDSKKEEYLNEKI